MTLLDVLAFVREWSAALWSLGCVFGIAVVLYLWGKTHTARTALSAIVQTDEGLVRGTLREFERLALTVVVLLVALLAVGVISWFFVPHTPLPPVMPTVQVVYALLTLGILIVLPEALTWIVYKAFRLYQG